METCASFVAFFDTFPGWAIVFIISFILGVLIGSFLSQDGSHV